MLLRLKKAHQPAEELSSQAVNMKEIVNSLVAIVNGASAIQETDTYCFNQQHS